MRRHWFAKRYADQVARMRVPSGFVLVILFAWLSRPSVRSLALGFPVSAVGLLLRAWAAGHLAKNQTLAESGPYAITRNPLYVGTVLVACGLAIAGRSAMLALAFAAFFVLIYLPVIELEEQHLRDLFPSYGEFARRVPLLLPRIPSSLGPAAFQPRLYVKNREYEALLGFLAGAAFLAIKWKWFR